MPGPADVVTGGYQWGLGGSGPSRRRGPRRPVRVTGARVAAAVGRAAPYLARGSWIAALGYAAYEAEAALIRRLEARQLETMTGIITKSDKAANEAYRKAKAKREKIEKEARARIAYNAAIYGGQAAPGPPAPWLIPGATRAYPGYENIIEVPNLPVPEAAPASTPGGTGTPGTTPTLPGVPVPAPPPGKYKKAAKAAYAWAQTPLGMTLIGSSLALFAMKGSKAAPYEAPFQEPLTDYQPEPLAYGELGGVPALDPGFEEEVADEGCENVQPKRAPGECRQGWFEESPSELRLREWSRRPCQ